MDWEADYSGYARLGVHSLLESHLLFKIIRELAEAIPMTMSRSVLGVTRYIILLLLW